ncbi:dihydroorotate dehydrogenase [Martelella limonii]|uniref:dihydroorotate dehydrogenase n=1 Tax=Martelella limonii TaxID=1647649 RepID=UPI00157FD7D6|nr:dihydroorotate dehydrogenase [Martelella limonii]
MADLTTRVGSMTLKNPIMPASGTFGLEMAEVFDLDCLGALVLKTVTPHLRSGNPVPRVCELEGGMLNSIGIPSKGGQYLIENTLPKFAPYSAPVVVSISADSAEAFAEFAESLSATNIDAIEANISCPNIEDDGKAFAMSAEATFKVISAIRRATHLPLWAKLSPNVGAPADIARAAEDAGADALVTTNTMLGMAVDVRTRAFKLGNIMGGLSGPALKPIALRVTYQCARAVSIPVIGCGGISSATDIMEYLIAGATAVQVGTANFIDPSIMPKLVTALADALDAEGIARSEDLVGAAISGDREIARVEEIA